MGIIATHPIQYQVPLFRRLAQAEGYFFKVYYGVLPDAKAQGRGFGVSFAWDIPMLDGYDWEELPRARSDIQPGRFFALRARGLKSIFQRDRLDAIIVTGWHSYLLLQALATARAMSLPCLVRGESNAMRPRAWWKRIIHRVLFKQYRALLSIGKENRRFYLENGVPPDRIFACPYFIDDERFVAQAMELREQRETIRREWGIGERTVCFIYAGKLEPKKRVLDLLRATDLLSNKQLALHLLVVGTGALMEQARELAVARNLPVTFAGFLNQTEISRAYVAADCLVLPSDFGETWGLVVNEAMASGLPAIVSDRVGCGPDLVEPNVTGMVFPFGDVASLADRMQAMVEAPNHMGAMGQGAKSRVLAAYSLERAMDGILRAVEYASRA